jgi:hypothetical protein
MSEPGTRRHPKRAGVPVSISLHPEAYRLLRERCPVGTRRQGEELSRLLFEDAARREARPPQEDPHAPAS